MCICMLFSELSTEHIVQLCSLPYFSFISFDERVGDHGGCFEGLVFCDSICIIYAVLDKEFLCSFLDLKRSAQLTISL